MRILCPETATRKPLDPTVNQRVKRQTVGGAISSPARWDKGCEFVFRQPLASFLVFFFGEMSPGRLGYWAYHGDTYREFCCSGSRLSGFEAQGGFSNLVDAHPD